jgi:3-dehydroquinate synthase
MKKILIPPSTELFFGSLQLFEKLPHLKPIVIADVALEHLYAKPLCARWGADLILIPSGEKAKTRQIKEKLEDALLEKGCGKDTVLIAVGGGSTSDLVGFTASTYLRGVPLILVPTTLVAMVDASIGGKTAIDTPHGKNLIGTFYPPRYILADTDTLKTLPEKEWKNGFAEILKMGLVCDPSILEADPASPSTILKAIEAKILITQKDPFDQSLRRILNFGHTIGHALETVSNYEISHGEAVAIGSMTEVYLSHLLGHLNQEDFLKIEKIYSSRFNLSLPKTYMRPALLKALLFDKKKELGLVRFVSLQKIGKAHPFNNSYCSPAPLKELELALDWMEKKYFLYDL